MRKPVFLHEGEDQFLVVSSALRRFLRLFRLVAGSSRVKETLARQVLVCPAST